VLGEGMQEHDAPRSLGLLRARREWPRRRAAEQRDECAPPHSIASSAPYRFGEKRVATLTLLTFTAPSRPRSCGVDITKFSDHVVAFLSSPTLFADTPMSRSISTRILSGKPPRAMWSAATLLGLYRIRVLPDGPIPLWSLPETVYDLIFTRSPRRRGRLVRASRQPYGEHRALADLARNRHVAAH